jgi:uncharacterized membrane protein YtjA (UPF0391 family)
MRKSSPIPSDSLSYMETVMLRLAIVFLIIALIAGALGLADTEYISSKIAWILFVIFLILFVVSLLTGRTRGPRL